MNTNIESSARQPDLHPDSDLEHLSSARANAGSEGSEPSGVRTERSCWICYATDEDNIHAKWVQPCSCRGSTKWVHQSCLNRWIDEKQRGNLRRTVMCQQCRTEYIIVFPPMNPISQILDTIDVAIRKICPYLAFGMLIFWIYWTAIAFGAITVVQVFGHQRGLKLMENELFMVVGLPFIPIGLVISQMIRWEDAILKFIRSKYNILKKLPFFKRADGSETENVGDQTDSSISQPYFQNNPPMSEPVFISRLICGAVFLPTLASSVGKLFFKCLEDPFHRAIVGGITYIGIKGILTIYIKQKHYIRRQQRRIVDHTEENVRKYMDGQTREAPAQDAQPDDNYNPGNEREFAGYDEVIADIANVVNSTLEAGDYDSENHHNED
ncbi:E3 ubiquitin-protein ligase MARCHF5 [Drosophila eugracilis]|uniref:E3 ubiquitin-protein ligase MARCHF5 n=1 Tax=Drosophila eugracilis TaxID=29029 RepID=UPI0007E87CD8|nr:E3 ubiquitin-protein ligase MARCHF5 [Drosophila eugracilis]